MEFAIATCSTKGQIVIPSRMRDGINPGDAFLIVREDDRIVMKRMEDIAEGLKDDLVFAERVERAWKAREKGRFASKPKDDFLDELRAC